MALNLLQSFSGGVVVEVEFKQHKINHFEVNNSVTLSTFTVLCNHLLYLVRNVASLKIEPHTHEAVSPPRSPRSLATTSLLSDSMDLPFLNILYKGNHVIYGLLCLALFHLTQYFQSSFMLWHASVLFTAE